MDRAEWGKIAVGRVHLQPSAEIVHVRNLAEVAFPPGPLRPSIARNAGIVALHVCGCFCNLLQGPCALMAWHAGKAILFVCLRSVQTLFTDIPFLVGKAMKLST